MKKSGPKLWKKAKKIIPGGSMLFSKRQELLLPGLWPSYYSKAKGCLVWDLDNKKYYDLFNGVGTNILGYANTKIDNAVINSIKKSNMSSLNSPFEVKLAEKLLELHPWLDMVRFARSGGEANSIAVRIARAASGRDCVAVCGYHGWHDWYLAANLEKKSNLNGHILKNLYHKGVPKDLAGSVKVFEYNNYNQLLDIVSKNNVGVIKMEVVRNLGPSNNFLQKVRELATKKNIVLIFDECTSGFRETYGGIHKKYKVYPDIAMFGKALGNGYAITAVVGKKKVMEAAQDTFISSTFWTEQIGSVAALKTLELMKQMESWKKISKIGEKIKKNWENISKVHGIKLNISGISALPSFTFENDNNNICKTFFTQEMLKKNILASNVIFVSTKHSSKILDRYFEVFNNTLKKISKFPTHKEISKSLKYENCHQTFQRLN